MDKQTEKELKASLEVATKILEADDLDLSPEEREKVERLRDQAAGALLSTWLPTGWPRRIILFTLIAVGVYGVVSGNWLLAIGLVLAVCFSPRAVGELILMTRDSQE